MSTVASATPPAREASSFDVPTMPIYRLSVAQYEAMAKHGILGAEDRVELLRGWLVPKMTKNTPHTITTGLVSDALAANMPANWHVRGREPIALEDSVPEPDVALTRGVRRDYLAGHPHATDVGLVVEVSDSSLADDRNIKVPMYAEAAIPTYWIVNLIDNVIEVYTSPTGPVESPRYTQRQDYQVGQEVPLVLDGQEVARIPVADLLP